MVILIVNLCSRREHSHPGITQVVISLFSKRLIWLQFAKHVLGIPQRRLNRTELVSHLKKIIIKIMNRGNNMKKWFKKVKRNRG